MPKGPIEVVSTRIKELDEITDINKFPKLLIRSLTMC